MRRTIIIMMGLTSLFAGPSLAAAVTWHNSGNTAFTATGGAATFSSTGVNLACASVTETATAPAGSFVGLTYTFTTGSESYSSCTLAGISTTVGCTKTITLSSATNGTSTLDGRVDRTCHVKQFAVDICTLHSKKRVTWHNPASPTPGRETSPPEQFLATNGTGGGSCPLGNGDTGTETAGGFTVTSASGGSGTLGPVITRTA